MTIDLRKHTQQHEAHRAAPVVREEFPKAVVRARTSRTSDRERAVMLIIGGIITVIVLILAAYGIARAWGHMFGGTEYEMKSLVHDVGEHMMLPENETPTLATVTDLHALEGQQFFRNAKEGDKVLMYLISQQAILYRPSIDRIIEVGPITGSAQ